MKPGKRFVLPSKSWSPPTRGAWIETQGACGMGQHCSGRPPRGGRGLKRADHEVIGATLGSPPTRGAWIETVLGWCPWS